MHSFTDIEGDTFTVNLHGGVVVLTMSAKGQADECVEFLAEDSGRIIDLIREVTR